jgi:hypothetical protein
MKRIKNLAIAKGFSAMLELARKMKRVRAMMLRWRHRLVMTVYQEWAEVVAMEIIERKRIAERDMFRSDLELAEATMNKRIIASVAQKMQLRGVTKAFNSWRHTVQSKVATRNRMKKVILRIQNMAMAAALLGWSTYIKRQKHVRYIGNKAIKRIQNIAMYKAFSAMLSLARKMKRVRKMMLVWRHRLAVTVFTEWADLVAWEISQRMQSGSASQLEEKSAALLAAEAEIERLQATIAEFDKRLHHMTDLPDFMEHIIKRRPSAIDKVRGSPGSARSPGSRGSPAGMP